VKKTVIIVKNNAFERLYQKSKTKEGKKDVFKIAKVREKKTRDLGNIRRIKGGDSKVLVEETRIRGDGGITFLCSLMARGVTISYA